jgi:chlorite dismutase
MPQEGQFSLNHFAALDFEPSFWQLSGTERTQRLKKFFDGLGETTDSFFLYQSYPLESQTELVVWSASQVTDTQQPKKFFGGWARASMALKPYLISRHNLWGFTRPSVYSKAKSSQEIDPFAGERSTYLVMYPFTKTADWYLLSQEDRQGMMNDHIRVGKGYREITQLLLYSFGLQDQEFIVVYETEDLQMFSKLVYDLRNTRARVYTKEDTPLHTGIHLTVEEALTHFS